MRDNGLHLSFRQREILAVLLNSRVPVEFSGLVGQYKLSAKSIRNDLKAVNQWVRQYGASIHTDEREILLVVPEERRKSFQAAFEKLDRTDYLCKNERVTYLLSRLLLASGPMTSICLCEDMKVSKPTILSDLMVVEEHLNRHNLILKRKRGLGYWVYGEEYQIRQAMERRILAMMKEYQITTTGALLSICTAAPGGNDPLYRFLAEADGMTVRQLLLLLVDSVDTDLPEETLRALAVTLLVMLKRNSQGASIQVDWPVCRQDVTDWPMSDLAESCLKLLREAGYLGLSPWERHFLVYKFYQYGLRLHFPPEQRREELLSTVRKMIWELEEQTLLQEDARERLESELYDQLDGILHRKKLNISFHDPIYVSTKAAYPQVFLTAQRLATVFQTEQEVPLSQEEIGELSLLLATYLAGETGERRAIVVCDKDDMLARILTRRLRNNVPEIVVERTMTLTEYQNCCLDLVDADMVISTVVLPNCPLPVFQVNPIVDYGELQRIRDYAAGRKITAAGRLKGKDIAARCLAGSVGKTITEKNIPALAEELARELGPAPDTARLLQCRETYSRDLANVFSRISVLVAAAGRITGKAISTDAVLGLAIHLTLSMVLWENGGIYPSPDATGLENEDPRLLEAVEDFLEDVGRQIGTRLPRSEAIPVLQYLKQAL